MSLTMADLSRSTKRSVTRASTSPKAINAGMNQEFVDTRRRLNDISQAIQKLSKSVESTRQTWSTVARQQRDFSQQLMSSFPQSGAVQQHAAEVEKQLRDIQQDIIRKDSEQSPHHQILSVMDQYVDMLRSIQSEYKAVEVSYTEKMRYQRKVDKLEKRSNPNRKHSDKIVRNVEKLNDAQRDLDTKLSAVMDRMRSAFQKHEAILQCAHHAFWMANNTHMDAIEQATKDIRVESVEVHKLLIGLDLNEDMIEPVPRLNLIKHENPNQIESGQAEPIQAITGASIAHSASAKSVTSTAQESSVDHAGTDIEDIPEDNTVSSKMTLEIEEELNRKMSNVPSHKPVAPMQKPILGAFSDVEAEPIAI